MVALGRLGTVFISIFTQIHLSMSYESGTLSMFQAMTFYETFGLEVAYKIIKRKLGCRVYIFSNLSQIWHDQEAIQNYDQIFMFIIGRTTKMYNLFEKLEEVNFQTGYELLAEEIVDGNIPYLDWATHYVPPYDAANETTVAENMFLPDTNEAFTFRENFINEKYGTLPPNHTLFAGLDLESNSNNSLQRMQRIDIKPYQDLLDRIKKGERFPPDAQFPGLELEQDDELRNIMEQQEEPIKEKLQLIREEKAREARRLRMRQWYHERNPPEMLERDMPRYYQRNPADFPDRYEPGYYEGNPADLPRRDMLRYEERAHELYGRNMPMYDERNPPQLPAQEMQRYYNQKAQEFYKPTYDEQNNQIYARNMPKNVIQNAQQQFYGNDRMPLNVQQNSNKNKQRSDQPKTEQTSKRRSIMDVIKSFIYSDPKPRETKVNRAKVGRRGAKIRERMQARPVTEIYQPYEFIQEENEMDEPVAEVEEPKAVKHYIFVQHVGNHDVNNVQEFRNQRNPANSRKSKGRKYDRQGPKTRQNGRARAANRKNAQNVKYNYEPQGVDTYHKNEPNFAHAAQNNPMGVHRVDQGINQAPGAMHPQAGNHFAHFHQINQANRFNPQHLHENIPLHQNIPQYHQFNKVVHANHMHENIHSPLVEHGHNIRPANMHENLAIHDNQQHHLHQMQHIIRPQNEHKDIGHFHPHEIIQHIHRLPAAHVDSVHKIMHGYHPPHVAVPFHNPNNLPILHQVPNRQLYQNVHVMNGQGIPNMGAAMKNPKIQNAAKIGKSRKVKSAPRVRKGRAGRPKAAMARKTKLSNTVKQYNVDIEGNTPVHFIDVLQYHYQPMRQNKMLMAQ